MDKSCGRDEKSGSQANERTFVVQPSPPQPPPPPPSSCPPPAPTTHLNKPPCDAVKLHTLQCGPQMPCACLQTHFTQYVWPIKVVSVTRPQDGFCSPLHNVSHELLPLAPLLNAVGQEAPPPHARHPSAVCRACENVESVSVGVLAEQSS